MCTGTVLALRLFCCFSSACLTCPRFNAVLGLQDTIGEIGEISRFPSSLRFFSTQVPRCYIKQISKRLLKPPKQNKKPTMLQN